MNKLAKILSATVIITSLVTITTTTTVFAKEAEASKNTTGTVTENSCTAHGVYHSGHYTKVVRTNSGGRTWGLAAVGNPKNSSGNMKIMVEIGGDYYGAKNGNSYVQTDTYNNWGSEMVRSSHS